jgi:hypothetical protein
MAADPREPLGRIVHEQRLAFNAEKERPFVLLPWEDRDEGQRELDMRIGAALRDRVLNTGPAGGELVRETWVHWALEQPDVAEHPNWLKSWAELDERDREVDDRIYSAVAARALAGWEAERTELTLARLSRSAVIARITALCRGIRRSAPDGVTPVVAVERILAITGELEKRSDEKGPDRD